MGIRLAIVDDNPHVTWAGRVHPVNATFQQFAAGLLDLPGSPVASITSCVPLAGRGGATDHRPARSADPCRRQRAVRRHRGLPARACRGCSGPTGPCSGASSARPISSGSRSRPRTPGWRPRSRCAPACRVSPGSRGVQERSPPVAITDRPGSGRVRSASGYDLVGRLAGAGGHRLVVGDGVVDRGGIVASLVEPAEIRDPDGALVAARRDWFRREPAGSSRVGRPAGRGEGARGADLGGRRRAGDRARPPRRRSRARGACRRPPIPPASPAG